MILWKILMLVALSISLLGLIVWYFLFRVFLKNNEEKTIDEIGSQVNSYLYWLLAIVIFTIILLIVSLIFKFTL
jgi:hypothetical protein